jgi:putative phage-type endonuclease
MAFTEKQKALRGQGVGGSEVAAVLGVHPHMTAFDVWAHKTGKLLEKEHDNDPTRNLPAYLGTRLEPLVAEVYEHRHPEFTLQPADTVVHPDFPFAIVTPDRMVHRRSSSGPLGTDHAYHAKPEKLLEIKTKSWRTARAFGEQGTDEVPGDVLCQAHWQLFVVGIAVVDIAVLIDGRDYREYSVQADAELHAAMLEKVRQFWHGNVLADIPPELKGRSVDPYLRQRFVMHDDTIKRADGLGEQWLAQLHEARQMRDVYEENVEAAANQIKLLIGQNKGIQGEVGKATWSQTKDATVVDWETVAKRYRTLLQKWGVDDRAMLEELESIVSDSTSIRKGSRRFLFSPAKEAK